MEFNSGYAKLKIEGDHLAIETNTVEAFREFLPKAGKAIGVLGPLLANFAEAPKGKSGEVRLDAILSVSITTSGGASTSSIVINALLPNYDGFLTIGTSNSSNPSIRIGIPHGRLEDAKSFKTALLQAISNSKKGIGQDSSSSEERKACPDCAEMIMLAAKKCRFCGYLYE